MPYARILGIALVISATLAAQDKKELPSGPKTFELDHFTLTSSIGAVPSTDFDTMLDGLYALWNRKLAGSPPDEKKIKVSLHYDRSEYARQAGAGGSYAVKGDTVHVLADSAYVRSIAAGGARLYVMAAYPKLEGRKDLPPWIAEGLANYFASAEWKEGKLLFDLAKAPETTKSLVGLQFLAKSSDWSSFEKSFKAEGKEFETRKRQIALQSWALFYYLFNAPGEEGGGGKNAQAVPEFLAALDSGKSAAEALAALAKRVTGGPVPSLESAVKDYFLRMKVEARKEDPDFLSLESTHYIFQVQKGATDRRTGATDKIVLAELKAKMELLFQKYSLAFKFQGSLPQKANVKVYKSREAYAAAGGPPSSAAYYSPETKELVGYEGGDEAGDLFQVFCHEGCHQFFDLAFPGFYASDTMPSWFSEGLADCFAASEIRGQSLYVFTLGGIAENRLYWIRQAVNQGKHTPLKTLFELKHGEFMANAHINYPESWSLVHFLWNCPTADEGKGTYHDVVVRLIDGFKAGKSRDEVYKQAFQLKGKPINIDELEREWKSYVTTLKK